jgi:1-acyl-sn-glycerol-3-phosphate acyltransferase
MHRTNPDSQKKKKNHRQLKALPKKAQQYQGNFWIMIFPEGTRIRPHKLQEAQQFAQQRGLPILSNVLIPRVKGMNSTLEAVRTTVDGVIDITIGYSEWTKKGHARPSGRFLGFCF